MTEDEEREPWIESPAERIDMTHNEDQSAARAEIDQFRAEIDKYRLALDAAKALEACVTKARDQLRAELDEAKRRIEELESELEREYPEDDWRRIGPNDAQTELIASTKLLNIVKASLVDAEAELIDLRASHAQAIAAAEEVVLRWCYAHHFLTTAYSITADSVDDILAAYRAKPAPTKESSNDDQACVVRPVDRGVLGSKESSPVHLPASVRSDNDSAVDPAPEGEHKSWCDLSVPFMKDAECTCERRKRKYKRWFVGHVGETDNTDRRLAPFTYKGEEE